MCSFYRRSFGCAPFSVFSQTYSFRFVPLYMLPLDMLHLMCFLRWAPFGMFSKGYCLCHAPLGNVHLINVHFHVLPLVCSRWHASFSVFHLVCSLRCAPFGVLPLVCVWRRELSSPASLFSHGSPRVDAAYRTQLAPCVNKTPRSGPVPTTHTAHTRARWVPPVDVTPVRTCAHLRAPPHHACV